MLNKHIIGELFEIAQDYEDGTLEFRQDETVKDVFYYQQITLFAENSRLGILNNSKEIYLITIRCSDYYIDFLDSLSKNQALTALYFLKEVYDNCKEYPNAFSNALKQMCYKYKKDKERNKLDAK